MPSVLDYSTPEKPESALHQLFEHVRRWNFRMIGGWMAGVLVVGLVGWSILVYLVSRDLRRYQAECAGVSFPRDQVMFTQDAELAATLAGDPAYFANEWMAERKTPDYLGKYLLSRDGSGSSWPPPKGVVFLGKRRSPNGTERIVWAAPGGMETINKYSIPTVWANTWPVSHSEPVAETSYKISGQMRFYNSYTIFAGQADPDREDHFIIPFEINGNKYHEDCWLVDSGEVKSNRIEEGTLTRPFRPGDDRW